MPSTQPAKRRSNTLAIILVPAIAALAGEWFWLRYNSPHAASSASDEGGCLIEARSAYSYYGSGIRPFYQPPYDVAKWDAFRLDLEKRISSAELKCSTCFEPGCNRARDAMSELKSVVFEFDSAVRSGSFAARPNAIIVHLQRVNDALR